MSFRFSVVFRYSVRDSKSKTKLNAPTRIFNAVSDDFYGAGGDCFLECDDFSAWISAKLLALLLVDDSGGFSYFFGGQYCRN